MEPATLSDVLGTPRKSSRTRPLFELRIHGEPGGEVSLAIWQLPGPATPRLSSPECTATLAGRPLRLIESRVVRRLKEAGIRVSGLRPGEVRRNDLDEEHGLNLALLFRTLAPMRSVERIRLVADGIDRMSREEAGYWLGMAIHRKHPRRVLAALRLLLSAS